MPDYCLYTEATLLRGTYVKNWTPNGVGTNVFAERPNMDFDTFYSELKDVYGNTTILAKQYFGYTSELMQRCVSATTTGITSLNTYVTGASFNCSSDVITFTNNDTGQFSIDLSCMSANTAVWSANTDGSISNSGLTDTKVGFGTRTPNEILTVNGNISGNSMFYGGGFEFGATDGTPNKINSTEGSARPTFIIDSTGPTIMNLYSQHTSTNIPVGLEFSSSTNGGYSIGLHRGFDRLDIFSGAVNNTKSIATFVSGMFSATNQTLTGSLGITGRTYLGTIDAAGVGYSNNQILVAQSNGEVEYLTASQLVGDLEGPYWSANTNGSISPTGLTTDIQIGQGAKVIFNSPSQNDIWIEADSNQMTLECDNVFQVKVDTSAEIRFNSAGGPFTLDAGGTNIYTFNVDSTPQLDTIGEFTVSAETITLKSVPTSLSNNTGAGDVVTFGSEDGTDTLDAGRLMYLNSSGVWKYADADSSSTGGSQLLAIALGTSVSDGLLLRGFFDATTYIQGSFTKGAPCYVSESASNVDFTQPSVTGDFVRVVGYGTDTANVIYFNPDGTYITIA